MISKTDSILFIYSISHIRVKVYLDRGVWHLFAWHQEFGPSRPASLCRIPDYAESSMKHLHLALSWRTETIKAIRNSVAYAACGMSAGPVLGFAMLQEAN